MAVLLAIVLALFSRALQQRLRPLVRHSAVLLTLPVALSAFFCVAAARLNTLTLPLALAVLAYTLAPTLVVRFIAAGRKPGALADLAAILLLWLPLEFGAGQTLVPRPAQGALHAVIYGVAILLGLVLFLLYRDLPGMRYQLPRRAADLARAVIGLAVCAAVLIPLGLAIGFLNAAHAPPVTGSRLALRIAFIFFGTALPEEILFRALIQNWLVTRFGDSTRSIAAAALIFGTAHLDNGPQPLPNWRYMIVASIAGFVFGKVFQRSTSVIASALTHTGVNTVKYVWF